MTEEVTEPVAPVETPSEENTQPQGAWHDSIEGLSQEHKDYIGDRSLDEFFEHQRSMRQSLSKRSEDIIKEGFIQPLGDDGDPIEFSKAHGKAATEVQQYMDARGLTEGDMNSHDRAEMEAALEAGLSVAAYTKMKETIASKADSISQEESEKHIAALRTEWGVDADRKTEMVERAVKEMGWGEEEMGHLNGLSQTQAVGVMKALSQIGSFLNEGGMPNLDNKSLGDTASAEEQLSNLEAEIAASGGVKTPEQERRHKTLMDKLYPVDGEAA